MVGANYTGGRRNAAIARSRDTAGRLQRGHFSKQRLGILTTALRSRRPDHQPLSRCRPSSAADNLNPISPPGYCTPAATVYDISLGHARRDLAQKQLKLCQQTKHDFYPHHHGDGPSSPSLQPGQPRPDPYVRNDLPTVTSVEPSTSLALTGKEEPDNAPSPQTLLLATALTPSTSHTIPPPQPEPAFPQPSLPEQQPTPATEMPPKRRSKILDLIDISNRELLLFPDAAVCRATCFQHTSRESRRASPFIMHHMHTPHYSPYAPP